MLSRPPLYVSLLSAAVVVTYAVAIWRLLRTESRWTLLSLLLIVAVGASIRAYQFPPLHIDEALTLECTRDDYEHGRLFDDNCNKMPSLVHVLFELPLVHWFGPDVVAIRAYAFLGSCAALAVAFALIRLMGGSVTAGLWGATVLAVLPWSIFHARIYQGGELLLNQLLLLSVLAAAIWQRVKLVDLCTGAVVICLAFYTYWSSRSMLGMPLLALLLARGWWNRLACLLVVALGTAGGLPLLLGTTEYRWTGLGVDLLGSEAQLAQTGQYAPLAAKFWAALTTLWAATGSDNWLSISSAGIHPVLLLLLAAAGMFGGSRAAVFLAVAFVAGLTPAVFGYGAGPSTHRMTLAYAVVPILGARGVDLLRSRKSVHAILAVVSLAVIAYQALSLYFSPPFQAGMNRWYDATRTAVIRDFPGNKRILTLDLWAFAETRRLDLGADRVQTLWGNNWFTENSHHAICAHRGLLSFYVDLVGWENIREYGSCFAADVPAGAWGERLHGWSYTMRCGQDVREKGIVPTLFYHHRARDTSPCGSEYDPREFKWKTRWIGDTRQVEFAAAYTDLTVTVDRETRISKPDRPAKFTVHPGSVIEVSVSYRGDLLVAMYVRTDSESRVAYWRETEPIGGEEESGHEELVLATTMHEHTRNPNTALLGTTTQRLRFAQQTGKSLAEISTVDCSRPLTLVLQTNAASAKEWAQTPGGKVVPGSRETLVVLRLMPADSDNFGLEKLSFCRQDFGEGRRTAEAASGTLVSPGGTAEPNATGPDQGMMQSLRRDLVLWLKADSLVGLPDAHPVAIWPDSSLVTAGATQNITDFTPSYFDNVRNGLPVVRFTARERDTLTVHDVPLSAHGTHFYVLQGTGMGQNFPFFEHGPNFNSAPGALLYGTAPMFGVYRDRELDVAHGQLDWLGTDWSVITVLYDGRTASGRFQVRKNGVVQDNGRITGTPRSDTIVTDTFYIGSRKQAAYWADMDLGEILLVNRALAPAEVGRIEAHLATKWGIPLKD